MDLDRIRYGMEKRVSRRSSLRRVVVLGNAGAGKTTFTHQLADLLKTPVAHLDELRYDDQWHERRSEDFAAAQEELMAGDRLIIDGNYFSTLPRRLEWADTAIWLDFSSARCLRRVLARYLRYGPGQHEGGIFVRLTWPFLWYVATFRRQRGAAIEATLRASEQRCQVVVLRNPAQVTGFLADLNKDLQGPSDTE